MVYIYEKELIKLTTECQFNMIFWKLNNDRTALLIGARTDIIHQEICTTLCSSISLNNHTYRNQQKCFINFS